jgi:hypothetical protein
MLEHYHFFIATRFELKKKVGVVGEFSTLQEFKSPPSPLLPLDS